MKNHSCPRQFLKAMDIQARICPGGRIYLYVGHTRLFLRQEEFRDVAQIVHAVEDHLLENTTEVAIE